MNAMQVSRPEFSDTKETGVTPSIQPLPPSSNNDSSLQSLQKETSWSECMQSYFMNLLARLLNVGVRLVDFFYAFFLCTYPRPPDLPILKETPVPIAQIPSLPPLTEEEIRDLKESFHILGNNNRLGIGAKQPQLEQIRVRTEQIHPFQSLTLMLTAETIKNDLINVRKNFKDAFGPKSFSPWHVFVGTIGAKIQLQIQKNSVWDHLNTFAAGIQRDPSKIRSFIENAKNDSDWESLLNYLIDDVKV